VRDHKRAVAAATGNRRTEMVSRWIHDPRDASDDQASRDNLIRAQRNLVCLTESDGSIRFLANRLSSQVCEADQMKYGVLFASPPEPNQAASDVKSRQEHEWTFATRVCVLMKGF
jgi:hypothetical protein